MPKTPKWRHLEVVVGSKNKKAKEAQKNKRRAASPELKRSIFLHAVSTLSNAIYQGRGTIGWSLVMVVVTFLGFYGYRGVVFSNAFAVNNIQVGGAATPLNQRVEEQLDVFRDKNIYRLRLLTIKEDLEKDPWIKSAKVSRAGLHTLDVSIESNKAAAVLNLNGFYLVDKEGKPFKRTRSTSEEMDGLILISGLRRDDVKMHPDWVDQKLKSLLKLLVTYKSKIQRPSLSEVVLTADDGAIFYTYDNGVAIDLGKFNEETFREKLHALDDAWMALSESEKTALSRMQIAKDSSSVTVTFKES